MATKKLVHRDRKLFLTSFKFNCNEKDRDKLAFLAACKRKTKSEVVRELINTAYMEVVV